MKTSELASEFETAFPRLFGTLEYHTCTSCGTPESSFDEGGQCDDCWQKSPERQAQIQEEERKHIELCRSIAIRELASEVSPELRDTDTDHPEFNAAAWNRIKGAWDSESSDWLWLHSLSSGRCKSRIAYLLLLEKYAAAISGRVSKMGSTNGRLPGLLWVDGDRLTEACRVRHQYSLGEKVMGAAHDLVEDARTVPFLVIDDLTKRKITGEAASDGLWEVIKHRHEWKLWTVITDNVRPENMEDLLHEKHAPYIIRRLAERCIQVDFDATPSECGQSGQSCESKSGGN
ncbi:hypothetical protein [Luteolibacter soli]